MPDAATLMKLLAAMGAKQDATRVAKKPDTRMTIKALGDAESEVMDINANANRLGVPALDYVREKTPSLLRDFALDPGITAGKKLTRGDVGGAALDVALNVPEIAKPLALGAAALRTGRVADAGEKALVRALKKKTAEPETLTGVAMRDKRTGEIHSQEGFDGGHGAVWRPLKEKNALMESFRDRWYDDGFITSTGRYVPRDEAMEIAKARHIWTGAKRERLEPSGKPGLMTEAINQANPEHRKAYELYDDFVARRASGAPNLAEPLRPEISPRKTVSTRVPTAVKATEDTLKENLLVGLESSRMDPKAFETNARLVSQYPNMPGNLVGAPAEEIAEKYVDETTNNLLWLHDQVPDDIRNRSKQWYVGARKIVDDWSQRDQLPDTQVAGVLAVLSPQKDWFMNTSLADRVISTVKNNLDTPWSNEMSETMNRIFAKPQYDMLRRNIAGKRLADLEDPFERAAWVRTYDEAHNARQYPLVHPEGDFGGPVLTQSGVPGKVAWGSLNEISKAINILNDASPENISRQLGGQHKVRNFYNNIIDPFSPEGHVTADTHAVAANLLRPLSGASSEVLHNFGSGGASSSSVFGSKGTYGLNVEPYRRAAAERGILPREMQSITWEAIRGLYPSPFKSQARNVGDIDEIWQRYRSGQLSLDEARRAAAERAGGIRPPDWHE